MKQITEETFEQVLQYFEKSSKIELQALSFIDPYGMVGLLEMGRVFQTASNLKALYLPKSEEKALLHGASRYADEGRGQGLAAVRRFVNQWNGKFSIRSGTAKLSIIPEWAWGKVRESNLTHFPGAQVNILLPEI